MDLTLEELCKQLRLSGVYSYVQEYSPDNDDLQDFLMSALQAELDKRRMSRRMRSLRIAGFPIKKRFENLIMDDLPQDGREAIPALKELDFLKERRNIIFIGNSWT
ncbi:MAG: ATP-binding protein [Methanothrix sp.]